MSWGGKVVGAGVGAVFGGPLGAAVGAGLGAVWDDVFGEDGPTVELQRVQFDTVVTTLGPGVRWLVTFTSDTPLHSDCVLVVRMKTQGAYIRAANDQYSDDDGDLVCAGPVELEPHGPSGAGFAIVPVLAFGRWPSALEMEATLVGPDGTTIAQATADFDWPKKVEFEDASLLGALVYTCIAMVCSDGKLERSEVQALRDFLVAEFELEPGAERGLKSMLKRAREARVSPRRAAEIIQPHMVEEMVQPVLAMLYTMASANGTVSREEESWISAFSEALGISEGARAAAKSGLGPDLEKYRQTLGVGPNATKAEIKQAYRREAADYHPDKVAGLPVGFRDFANQKMKELNEAYDALKS